MAKWFQDLSPQARQAYLRDHPRSKLRNKTGKKTLGLKSSAKGKVVLASSKSVVSKKPAVRTLGDAKPKLRGM